MLLPVTCRLSAYRHVLRRYDGGSRPSGLLQQLRQIRFIVAFAKLRKATISFVTSCLPGSMQHLGSNRTQFREN